MHPSDLKIMMLPFILFPLSFASALGCAYWTEMSIWFGFLSFGTFIGGAITAGISIGMWVDKN